MIPGKKNDQDRIDKLFEWQTAMCTIQNPTFVFNLIKERIDAKVFDHEMEMWLCQLLDQHSCITPEELLFYHRIQSFKITNPELYHAELLARNEALSNSTTTHYAAMLTKKKQELFDFKIQIDDSKTSIVRQDIKVL
jgi:hypothetical protein